MTRPTGALEDGAKSPGERLPYNVALAIDPRREQPCNPYSYSVSLQAPWTMFRGRLGVS